ncbi:hypothetical protein KCU98_g146, partial [Aureobasidium melanogenum]
MQYRLGAKTALTTYEYDHNPGGITNNSDQQSRNNDRRSLVRGLPVLQWDVVSTRGYREHESRMVAVFNAPMCTSLAGRRVFPDPASPKSLPTANFLIYSSTTIKIEMYLRRS